MNEFHVMAIGLQSNAEFGNRWKGIMRLLEMCKNSMELFSAEKMIDPLISV